MQLEIHSTLTQLSNQLIIPLSQSKKLSQQLKKIAIKANCEDSLLKNAFSAAHKSIYTISIHNKICYLLGLGSTPNTQAIETAFQHLAIRKKAQLSSQLGIYLLADNQPSSKNIATWLEAMTRGLTLGTYDIGLYKSKNKKHHPLKQKDTTLHFYLQTKTKQHSLAAIHKGQIIAQTTCRILDLVNAPSNYKQANVLAKWAVKSGKKYGYKVTVMDKAAIEAAGLHTLLAVNRGSEAPPAFIIMEYLPKNRTSKKLPSIGLVGKGVTFDTGGLSLKRPTNMHYMKSDMGGAAAVLGTMEATARLQLPVRLTGIVPATDNCIDAHAINPGDVIDSYSGKTIEVIDTDAEGRLILADGLAYINKNYDIDTLIDLATLTGSCVRTLGYEAGGLFSNNATLAKKLLKAGIESGEKLWQLPLWDAYLQDIQSDVADIKNLSAKPLAGASVAAKFLEFFTDKHPNWAHLDIAGVAFGNSPFSRDKSATGFGIKLLLKFLEMIKN